LVRQIQAYLKARGAPSLHVDGDWKGCTASAWKYQHGGDPFVKSAQIYEATGQRCKSENVVWGDIVPDFTVSNVNVCTDCTDGVPVEGRCPGGGGPVPQQCPQGQHWEPMISQCLPDPISTIPPISPTVPPPQPGQPPPAGQCPAGQTYVPMLGCMPIGATGPGGGGGGGVVNPPSECAAGQTKNPFPFGPKCIGSGPSEPSECPGGQVKTPAGCVGMPGQPPTDTHGCQQGQTYLPIIGCVGTPAIPGQPPPSGPPQPGGQCPSGQFGVPPFCFGTPAPGDTSIPPIGGACPAGQYGFPPFCFGQTTPPGPVPPGYPPTPTPPGTSLLGKYWWVILGVLGVGAAAVGYIAYKRKKVAEEGMLGGPAMGDEFGLAGLEPGMDELGMGEDLGAGAYGEPAFYSANRKRKRARRRRGRKARRNCSN
jgi:hypothetical protein